MIKFSFIIPTYNSKNDVLIAIKSIPNREDIEIIIVDDASTDNTIELINDYINKNNI